MTRFRTTSALALVAGLLGALLVAAPGAEAGPGLLPWASGTVVDSATGERLEAVVVELRDPVSLAPIASDTTNRRGVFRIHHLDMDEYAVWVDGAPGHEAGYLACDSTVVPTYGEACTSGTGRYRDLLLDRLP